MQYFSLRCLSVKVASTLFVAFKTLLRQFEKTKWQPDPASLQKGHESVIPAKNASWTFRNANSLKECSSTNSNLNTATNPRSPSLLTTKSLVTWKTTAWPRIPFAIWTARLAKKPALGTAKSKSWMIESQITLRSAPRLALRQLTLSLFAQVLAQ